MTVQLFDQPIFVTLWVYFAVILWLVFAVLVIVDGFQRTRPENQRYLVTAFFLCVGAVLLSEIQKPSTALRLLHLHTKHELLPVNVSVVSTVNTALGVFQLIFATIAWFLIVRVASRFLTGTMSMPPGALASGDAKKPPASEEGKDNPQREMNSARPLGKEHQPDVIERTMRK